MCGADLCAMRQKTHVAFAFIAAGTALYFSTSSDDGNMSSSIAKARAANAQLNLSGKQAVVVGGTSGIGHGIAVRLEQARASVTIVGRSATRGAKSLTCCCVCGSRRRSTSGCQHGSVAARTEWLTISATIWKISIQHARRQALSNRSFFRTEHTAHCPSCVIPRSIGRMACKSTPRWVVKSTHSTTASCRRAVRRIRAATIPFTMRTHAAKTDINIQCTVARRKNTAARSSRK